MMNDDNRANQLNSNNDAYWQSRGMETRPNESDDDEDDYEAELELARRRMRARLDVLAAGEKTWIESERERRLRDNMPSSSKFTKADL